MAWSWMEGASGWIIPSPNVHTHLHQASTWVGPHSEYFSGQKTHSDKYAELVWVVCIKTSNVTLLVMEAEAAAVAVAVAVAGDETRITIVATTDTTVMTSMTTDTGNIEYILQCGKHF